MHIPPEKLLPQDLVDVFDHGPPDEPFAIPVEVRMHAVDAKHAIDVDPARWAFEAGDIHRKPDEAKSIAETKTEPAPASKSILFGGTPAPKPEPAKDLI